MTAARPAPALRADARESRATWRWRRWSTLGVPPAVVTTAIAAWACAGLRVAFGTRKRGAFVGKSFDVDLARPSHAPAAARARRTRSRHDHGHDHDHARTTHHDARARSPRLRGDQAAAQARAPRRRRARARRPTSSRASPRSRPTLHGTRVDRVAFHEVGRLRLDRRRRRCRRRDRLPGARVDRLVAAGRRARASSARRTGRCRCRRPRPPRCWRGDPDRARRAGRADHADRRRDPGRGRRPVRAAAADARCARSATARARASSPIAPTCCASLVGEPLGAPDAPPRRRGAAGRGEHRRHEPASWSAPLFDALLAAGAVDVWSAPILMKKGRPGACRCRRWRRPRPRAAVERAFFRNSTTLGVRRRRAGARGARALVRRRSPRRTARCASSWPRSTARCWARSPSSRTAAAWRRGPASRCARWCAAAAAAARALAAGARAEAARVSRARSAARALDEPGQGRAGAGRRHRREPAARGGRARRASRSARRRSACWRVLADPDTVYMVADSDETETGRMRLPLAQYPHIRRALEAGEVTSTGGGGDADRAEVVGRSSR